MIKILALFGLLSISSTVFAVELKLSDLKNIRLEAKNEFKSFIVELADGNTKVSHLVDMDEKNYIISYQAEATLVKFSKFSAKNKLNEEQDLLLPSVGNGCAISGCYIYENGTLLTDQTERKKVLEKIFLEDDSQAFLVSLPTKEVLDSILISRKKIVAKFSLFGDLENSEGLSLGFARLKNKE
ncbi:MAG: hypothetical protein AABY64_08455 [Bdellovibrionota bacterium]